MSQKKRKYQDNYLDFGFTYLIEDDLQIPQCVVCMKTFSNSTMKPASLKQHLTRRCSSKYDEQKPVPFLIQNCPVAVHASYAIALHVAKTKKHITLVKPF